MKVLIATYYWPPAGGAGVQRWLKFAKYLPEYGITPIVYTVHNPTAPNYDRSLEKDISPDLEVVKETVWEPYDLYRKFTGKKKGETISHGFIQRKGKKEGIKEKLSRWIRGNIFIPDPRVFWVKPGIKTIEQLHKTHQFDAIISTGPPHSTHIMAMKAAKKLNLKWLADFRDPWTKIDFIDDLMLTNIARKKHENLEHQVLKNADVAIGISPQMIRQLAALGSNNSIFIPNGYDHTDFETTLPAKENNKFTLRYVGSLNKARNPQVLIDVLSQWKKEKNPIIDQILVESIGDVDGSIVAQIDANGLTDIFKFLPPVSHQEAVKFMRTSSALLLIINNVEGKEGILTGKIFEYLACNVPIVNIGPVNGDAAAIISDQNAGKTLDYQDIKGFEAYLKSLINEPESQEKVLDRTTYSRRNLTRQLAELIVSTIKKS